MTNSCGAYVYDDDTMHCRECGEYWSMRQVPRCYRNMDRDRRDDRRALVWFAGGALYGIAVHALAIYGLFQL